MLQPALFLHFALTSRRTPEARPTTPGRCRSYTCRGRPAGIRLWLYQFSSPLNPCAGTWTRLQRVYPALYFTPAAVFLGAAYQSAGTPLLRQQLKWVTRGTMLAVVPYTLFYVVPFLAGSLPTPVMKISVLSLVFLPLTFGYAIVRYRLMDVDLIFKRGIAYTLARPPLWGCTFVWSPALAGTASHQNPSTGPFGLIAGHRRHRAIVRSGTRNGFRTASISFFYRKRYDYRRTLIEFGRELSSETDLDAMLTSVIDRLSRTLLVDRIAIFLRPTTRPTHFVLAKSFGISTTGALDLELPERSAS